MVVHRSADLCNAPDSVVLALNLLNVPCMNLRAPDIQAWLGHLTESITALVKNTGQQECVVTIGAAPAYMSGLGEELTRRLHERGLTGVRIHTITDSHLPRIIACEFEPKGR